MKLNYGYCLMLKFSLRMFTGWGMEREVISLAGPLVSMAGSDSRLVLAVHAGSPLPDQQSLGFYTLDVNFRQKYI